MAADSKPRRARFSFSLRTLFVVVTVGCVWLGYHLNWIRERHAALDWVASHGWFHRFNYETQDAAQSGWGLRCFGEGGVFVIGINPTALETELSTERVRQLRILFPEARHIIHYPCDSGEYTDAHPHLTGDITEHYALPRPTH